MTDTAAGTLETRPRERILDSAYDLFSQRGISAVGVEELIARASVAKATFYRHFPSKNDLVLAFLQRREERWTYGWVETEARARGGTPEDSLLAIFDLFDEWFHRDDFEGCSFVNVLLGDRRPREQRRRGERDAPGEHPRRRPHARHRGRAARRREFALSFHILMKGSIVQAGEGDLGAASAPRAWRARSSSSTARPATPRGRRRACRARRRGRRTTPCAPLTAG
jgi:Transcriptional regulator